MLLLFGLEIHLYRFDLVVILLLTVDSMLVVLRNFAKVKPHMQQKSLFITRFLSIADENNNKWHIFAK